MRDIQISPPLTDKGRPKVQPLLAHSSKQQVPHLKNYQRVQIPHSSPILQSWSHWISLSIREGKIAFLEADSRRQRLFQRNDLQIKSMKTRKHLLNLFPIQPRCPHNFLPQHSCYFCYQSNNLPCAFFKCWRRSCPVISKHMFLILIRLWIPKE